MLIGLQDRLLSGRPVVKYRFSLGEGYLRGKSRFETLSGAAPVTSPKGLQLKKMGKDFSTEGHAFLKLHNKC